MTNSAIQKEDSFRFEMNIAVLGIKGCHARSGAVSVSPPRATVRSHKSPIILQIASLLSLILLFSLSFTSQLQAHSGPFTLTARGDTYLRQWLPNHNQGTQAILQVRALGNNRVLVQFDQAGIVTAIGVGTLGSVKLRLHISFNANNWGPSGREINVHRMTQAWTERGATWNCPNDTNPSNFRPDCNPGWDMENTIDWPFVQTRTAAVVHRNGASGWVEWDVTQDVGLFLNGTVTNYGWIVRKDSESLSGQVDYSSREGKFPPQLVLTVWPRDTLDTVGD